MPITIATPIRIYTQDEFHALDRRIMGVVFEVHNEFGRLLDERLFKGLIARRCAAAGLAPVEREVHIRVTHRSFAKDYYIDLLFGSGVVLEAKAAETLTPTHDAQTLNYILLAGLHHAALVNLRPDRVQRRFVSTQLTPEKRRAFRFAETHWRPLSAACQQLRATLHDVLLDWGAFLEVNLYREALLHFLGSGHLPGSVDVLDGDDVIGQQPVPLIAPDIALACTALARRPEAMQRHLQRFLAHTRLRAFQWINFNHDTIELTTLTR